MLIETHPIPTMRPKVWTQDPDGNYVDWTKHPYRHEGSGLLNLVMDHEDPARVSHDVLSQRIHEYTLLVRQNLGL